MGSGLSLDPYGIFALQRALSLQPALSGVPRYENILLCVRMLSVGLRPHIYCHILVRLILCARMSAKYLFSNVERGSIPPHTLPHSHAPHSPARLTLYKGLHPLLSELELELIQTQMAQKPMLRAEVGMRVRCANKASAE